MKWKPIKDWLQTITLIGMVIWFVVIQVNQHHDDVTLPTHWEIAPVGCYVEETTGYKEQCKDFLPQKDDVTGVYRQLISRLGECELYRTRYRGFYYIANTCGGLLLEPN